MSREEIVGTEPGARGGRRVVFLLLPGVHLLDLGGAAQVFYEAGEAGASYEIAFAAAGPVVRTAQGLELRPDTPPPAVRGEDLVVVPGTESNDLDALAREVPTDWLAGAAAAGAQVCAVCSGAFALGHAGLLDGRRCTTHWKVLDRLRSEFPRARCLRDRLYVEDSGVWTSAGEAAGIDLALALVEAHHGPLMAARVAREMVVYFRRSGERCQHSVFLDHRTHLHPGVHRVQDWLINHPEENPSLEEMADLAGMSPRHLTRRFRELTGVTVKEFSHRIKLEVAESLLRSPDLTVSAVARRCGFEHPRQLRRLWRRRHGSSPGEWRRRAGSM